VGVKSNAFPQNKGRRGHSTTDQMANAIQSKHKTHAFILGTGMKKTLLKWEVGDQKLTGLIT